MSETASKFECVACGETFAINPEHDAAAEYEARFGATPRTDDLVCEDCYQKILTASGHCDECLNKPCTCKGTSA